MYSFHFIHILKAQCTGGVWPAWLQSGWIMAGPVGRKKWQEVDLPALPLIGIGGRSGVGSGKTRDCRRLASQPHALLGQGLIRGEAHQVEGMWSNQDGRGPAGMWLAKGRGCKKLAGQYHPLLRWGGNQEWPA